MQKILVVDDEVVIVNLLQSFLRWKEYEVVTISIDPRDTPRDAAAKKEMVVKRYGRLLTAPAWHFLTGPESAVRKIAIPLLPAATPRLAVTQAVRGVTMSGADPAIAAIRTRPIGCQCRPPSREL